MSILEQLVYMRMNHEYDRQTLEEIADDMEELLGEAEMWRTLRPAFSVEEFLENLEYIAREEDL